MVVIVGRFIYLVYASTRIFFRSISSSSRQYGMIILRQVLRRLTFHV